MAPPDTNIEKQKRRHATPLVGMAFVVALALIGLVLWLGSAFLAGDAPRDVPEDEQVRPLEEELGG